MSSENHEDVKVLASNRCLMNNMLVFHIKALLESQNIPPLRYHTAFYSYSEPHRLQALLGTTRKIERKGSSGLWEIEIGETWIPLPSPEAVIHGELQLLPEVYDLLNLRGKILEELQGYEMLDSLETKEDRQAYLSTLLKERTTKEKKHGWSIYSYNYAKL